MTGSDGTERTLREAISMGKPSIFAEREMLPELVEDGGSGFWVKDSPEELSQATLMFPQDPELRKKMGQAACEKPNENSVWIVKLRQWKYFTKRS